MSIFSNILYVFLCIILAYAPYKPNQKKLFIGASLQYAVFVSVWFCICSLALIYPTAVTLLMDHRFDWIFPLMTILWFVSPYVVRKFGSLPNMEIADKPARLLIRFEPKMFLTKYFEILFQQSMFVYVLFVVLTGMTFWSTMVWFTVMIGLIHLGNFPFTGKKDTLFYFYLSLPMAVAFGWLILQGYVAITIAMHMLFYLVFNGRYWFIHSNHK